MEGVQLTCYRNLRKMSKFSYLFLLSVTLAHKFFERDPPVTRWRRMFLRLFKRTYLRTSNTSKWKASFTSFRYYKTWLQRNNWILVSIRRCCWWRYYFWIKDTFKLYFKNFFRPINSDKIQYFLKVTVRFHPFPPSTSQVCQKNYTHFKLKDSTLAGKRPPTFRLKRPLFLKFETNQSQSVQNVDLIPSKEYKDSAHKTFITEVKLFK